MGTAPLGQVIVFWGPRAWGNAPEAGGGGGGGAGGAALLTWTEAEADDEFPARSVARAVIRCGPSARARVSSETDQLTVPVASWSAPLSNWTSTLASAASSEAVPEIVTVPERVAASAGDEMATTGAVASGEARLQRGWFGFLSQRTFCSEVAAGSPTMRPSGAQPTNGIAV